MIKLSELPSLETSSNILAQYLQHFNKEDIEFFNECMKEHGVNTLLYVFPKTNEDLSFVNDDNTPLDGESREKLFMALGYNLKIILHRDTSGNELAVINRLIWLSGAKLGVGILPPVQESLSSYDSHG